MYGNQRAPHVSQTHGMRPRRLRRNNLLALALSILALVLITGCSPSHSAFGAADHPTNPAPSGPAILLPASWTATPDPIHPLQAAALSIPQPEPTPTSTATPIPFTEGPLIIGYSVAGRPLEVYRFGRGPVERMIVAGIHGGYEWNTTALANALLEYLGQYPEIIPPEITLFILPCLNPDGEARSYGYEGRANENGVDLNRNWPQGWQEDWDRTGCWNYLPISSGPHPASEPETRALMNFLNQHSIDALISYHSAALGIFPAGDPPHPPSVRLAEAVAAVSNYRYPPLNTGCVYTGGLVDWAATKGIAAIDLELTDHQNIDFDQNLLILDTFVHWQP